MTTVYEMSVIVHGGFFARIGPEEFSADSHRFVLHFFGPSSIMQLAGRIPVFDGTGGTYCVASAGGGVTAGGIEYEKKQDKRSLPDGAGAADCH